MKGDYPFDRDEAAKLGAADTVPQTQCPRCGLWQDDYDGFGVMKCLSCDYCKHPARMDGVCEICGHSQSDRGGVE